MRKLITLLIVATVLLLVASCSGGNPIGPAREADMGPAAQSWLITLGDNVNPNIMANQLRAEGKPVDFVYTHAIKGLAVRMSGQAAANLAVNPNVILIEPDLPVTIVAPGGVPGPPGGKPDDDEEEHPPQEIPSGVDRIDADLNANTGAGVEVAVLDTGISLKHADLAANILGDVNFVKTRKSGDDDNFHGTHVSGIIAAIDNEIGVVGVAPEAGLWAVKVLDSKGNGYISNVIAGIDWVTANAGHIDVVNMSFTAYGTSSTLHAAIQGMVNAGVTAVAAAGNDYNNTAYYIPASYDEVIAVSGIHDTNDAFYHWSNWGPAIDLIAPGVDIYSTLTGTRGLPLYGELTGTSMAAPHVAGCAALYIASNPGSTPAQVMAGLIAAGYLPPGIWIDDPLVLGDHPDPDATTEKLVMAGSL